MTNINAFFRTLLFSFLNLLLGMFHSIKKFASRFYVNENRRREIPGIKLFKGRGKFLKKVWCCAHGGV